MAVLYIAYVDDEPAALQNFRYVMEECKLGDHIRLFSDPKTFLFHAKNNPIDMAFLDVDLPGTTGFALAEELRGIHPDLPIAFITGNVEYMNKNNRVVQAPYIFKPYGKEEVLEALPQHIMAVLKDM